MTADWQAIADDHAKAVDAAETGHNEFGPYWNTAKLVEAVRAFQAAYRAAKEAQPRDPNLETLKKETK